MRDALLQVYRPELQLWAEQYSNSEKIKLDSI